MTPRPARKQRGHRLLGSRAKACRCDRNCLHDLICPAYHWQSNGAAVSRRGGSPLRPMGCSQPMLGPVVAQKKAVLPWQWVGPFRRGRRSRARCPPPLPRAAGRGAIQRSHLAPLGFRCPRILCPRPNAILECPGGIATEECSYIFPDFGLRFTVPTNTLLKLARSNWLVHEAMCIAYLMRI